MVASRSPPKFQRATCSVLPQVPKAPTLRREVPGGRPFAVPEPVGCGGVGSASRMWRTPSGDTERLLLNGYEAWSCMNDLLFFFYGWWMVYCIHYIYIYIICGTSGQEKLVTLLHRRVHFI